MNESVSPQTNPANSGGSKSFRIPVGWASTTRFKVPVPKNEKERLVVLHQYEILDTLPEEVFNDVASLASMICGTPIAMISLVDSNRQWFKAKVGITTEETSRDIAFCAHGIMQKELFIVPDATLDERFANNPLVTSDPKIRFYAGAPLIAEGDRAIGMLCVVDRVPRQLRPDQAEALRLLGRHVMSLLDLRKQVKELTAKLAPTEGGPEQNA